MRLLARWHIRLGWVVAVPLLLWTISGLFMVLRPMEHVRGEDRRIEAPPQVLPAGTFPFAGAAGPAATKYEIAMRDGVPTALVTYANGQTALFALADGRRLSPIDAAAAGRIVAKQVTDAQINAVKLFEAFEVPIDFRREMPVWQVALRDGTHVYVGRDTARIEAVRTRWWRWFDLMWGLHIMDLGAREDTAHPLLQISAALGLIGVLMGTVLLFRRRRVARA
jgi:hypothetical protein